MAENKRRGYIPERLRLYAVHLGAILIDSIFLVLWVIIQRLANYMIERFSPSGIDLWVLIIFRILFALATLAPIAANIVGDILLIILSTRRRVQREAAELRPGSP